MPVFSPTPGVVTLGPIAGRSYAGAVDDLRITNELVRITGNVALPSFTVEFWDGTAWREKGLVLWHLSTPLTFNRVSILENRPEVVIIQYEHTLAVGGRVTVDVTLRRGMRAVLFQMSTNVSTNFQASPYPTEPMTKTAERELSNSADANGHKLLMGSPVTWSQTAGSGLMTVFGLKTWTLYVGLVLNAAAAGDTALDLSMQAVGVLSETVRPSRR